MRVIVAGSRSITRYRTVEDAILDSGLPVSVIISGGARGVDQLGERFADEWGIPLKRYPANWDLYGKAAGVIRNEEMAKNADALVAVWDNKSRGTKHMVETARTMGLKVFLVVV